MSTWLCTVQKVKEERFRADQWIMNALELNLGEWKGEPITCSRSQLQRLIAEKKVLVDGQSITSNTKMKLGSKVQIDFPPPEPLDLKPEDHRLDILFEDSHLLVLNKPPGLVVHPADQGKKEGTLVNALLFHIKDLSGIGGKLRPGIVHRLDKDTSGALVVTKDDETHRHLSEIFSKHDIERTYWALCYGAPPEGKIHKIETTIGRHPTHRQKMAVNVKGGREAISYARRLEVFSEKGKLPFACLMEVKLETGRTHQVRVHLTHLGYSLLGDPVYGKPTSQQKKWLDLPDDVRARVGELSGQALHARVLGFTHPMTQKNIRLEAEPYLVFQKLLDTLRKYKKDVTE